MNHLHIAHRRIGPDEPPLVIAEIGVNHNGDLDLARSLVRKAKECGADCVKFQTFQASRVVTAQAPKAGYQLRVTDPGQSQVDMLAELELNQADWQLLFQYCQQLDILFLSTPYNFADVDLLEDLGVPAYKVASGQAVEPAFLRHVAQKNKPVLLSTGMCTLAEVDQAVRTLRQAGNDQILLFQCTTNYPSAMDDCNLAAMNVMARATGTLPAYSDHTQGIVAATVAVGLGACAIEKHFTMDTKLPGPDHSCSATPEELSALVAAVRQARQCIGTGRKEPCEAELANAPGMRRSIVAARPIAKGAAIALADIEFKRPATGLAPALLDLVLGRTAGRDIAPDEFISLDILG